MIEYVDIIYYNFKQTRLTISKKWVVNEIDIDKYGFIEKKTKFDVLLIMFSSKNKIYPRAARNIKRMKYLYDY